MSRELPMWVGKTHDSKVPPRVRLRVFEREEGRCWISGRKIMPGDVWELDHKVALINGGSHSEDNLAPALREKHREKTAEDVAIKSKTYRQRAKHLGIWPKSNTRWPKRSFDQSRPLASNREGSQ